MIYTMGLSSQIPSSHPWTSDQSVSLRPEDWVVVDPSGSRCEWELVSYHPYRYRLRAIVPTGQQQALLARFVREGGRLVTFMTNDWDRQGRVWTFTEEIDAYPEVLPIHARGEDWAELLIPPYDWLDGIEPGLAPIAAQLATTRESWAWTREGQHYTAWALMPSWTAIPIGKGWVLIGPRPHLSSMASFETMVSMLWDTLLQEGIA